MPPLLCCFRPCRPRPDSDLSEARPRAVHVPDLPRPEPRIGVPHPLASHPIELTQVISSCSEGPAGGATSLSIETGSAETAERAVSASQKSAGRARGARRAPAGHGESAAVAKLPGSGRAEDDIENKGGRARRSEDDKDEGYEPKDENDGGGVDPDSYAAVHGRLGGNTPDLGHATLAGHNQPQPTAQPDPDSRSHSAVSIGNSEPEVARRVELKRIMHRQIQEEMNNDDDGGGGDTGRSGRPHSSPLGPPPPARASGGGARDTIEFKVVDITSMRAFPTTGSQGGTPGRCSSAPYPANTRLPPQLGHELVRTDRTPIPDLPPAPGLSPLRPPSVYDGASLKSWRLSSGVLGPVPAALAAPASPDLRTISSGSQEGNSALATWVLAQRQLGSAYSSPSDRSKNSVGRKIMSRQGDGEDKDKVQLHESVHLYDMNIPARLSVRSRPVSMVTGGGGGAVVGEAKGAASGHDSRMHPYGSDEAEKGSGSHQAAHADADAHSSTHQYPSDVASLGASAVDSEAPSMRRRSERFTLDPETLQALQLAPFHWNTGIHTDAELSDGLGSYLTVEGGGAGPSPSTTGADDGASMQPDQASSFSGSEAAFSDTSSSRYGEAANKSRLGRVLGRRSKHRPGAAVETEPWAGGGGALGDHAGSPLYHDRRPSLLSKLHLIVPGRAWTPSSRRGSDNPDSEPGPRRISNLSIRPHPMQPICHTPDPQPAPASQPPAESTSEMWQRAIRQEAERRGSHAAGGGALSSQAGLTTTGRWRGDDGRGYSASSVATATQPPRLSDPFHAADDEIGPVKSVAQSDRDRGVQVRPAVHLGQVMGRKEVRRMTSSPPPSWARWPSHDRGSRIGSTGPGDDVTPRDFAVRAISPEGDIEWSTDKKDGDKSKSGIGPGSLPGIGVEPGPASRNSAGRVLSRRLSHVVRSGLEKLNRTKSGLGEELMGSPLQGRRGSVHPGGQLEYPELEILPTEGGFKELRALETEIEQLKGHEPKSNSRPSLVLRNTFSDVLRGQPGEEGGQFGGIKDSISISHSRHAGRADEGGQFHEDTAAAGSRPILRLEIPIRDRAREATAETTTMANTTTTNRAVTPESRLRRSGEESVELPRQDDQTTRPLELAGEDSTLSDLAVSDRACGGPNPWRSGAVAAATEDPVRRRNGQSAGSARSYN